MKNVFNFSNISILLISTIVLIASCGKKDPAKAEITVLDRTGERVEGATVNIICTPIEKSECAEGVEQEGVTNSAGKAEFEWDHPAIYGSDDVGFAVLKVEARANFDSTYCITTVDSLGNTVETCSDSTYIMYGSSFIELQIEKVTKETITVLVP